MTPEKTKKTPERRCIGCGQSFPKKELLRVVREPDGNVALDFTGKKNGRGAYLCKKLSCLKKANKQGRLKTNLQCDIPDELAKALEEEIAIFEKEASDGE